MNPFYTSHRIGQLILKRSALPGWLVFLCLYVVTQSRMRERCKQIRPLHVTRITSVQVLYWCICGSKIITYVITLTLFNGTHDESPEVVLQSARQSDAGHLVSHHYSRRNLHRPLYFA